MSMTNFIHFGIGEQNGWTCCVNHFASSRIKTNAELVYTRSVLINNAHSLIYASPNKAKRKQIKKGKKRKNCLLIFSLVGCDCQHMIKYIGIEGTQNSSHSHKIRIFRSSFVPWMCLYIMLLMWSTQSNEYIMHWIENWRSHQPSAPVQWIINRFITNGIILCQYECVHIQWMVCTSNNPNNDKRTNKHSLTFIIVQSRQDWTKN